MTGRILTGFFIAAGIVAGTLVTSVSARAQDEDLESRVAALEAKVAALEERLTDVAVGGPPQMAGDDLALEEMPVAMKLLKKEFHEGDLLTGEVGDRILLDLEFKSNLKKSVRAFTGVTVFRDVFDREVLRASLTCSKGFRPRGTVLWRGWLGYQQFDEGHRRLRNLAQSELDTDFVLERVIYADGSRVLFAEPDETKSAQNKLVGDGTESGTKPAPAGPAAPTLEEALGERGAVEVGSPTGPALE